MDADSEKLMVLDVGCGNKSTARVLFPDAVITTLDSNPDLGPDVVLDFVHNPLPDGLQGQFDIVFVSHVLEHVDRMKVLPAVKNLILALKRGGMLWAVTPALEWAASEVLNKPAPSKALISFLYGSQDGEFMYHRSGYTLGMLRDVMRICGLQVRKATQSKFTIDMENGPVEAIQNVVVAERI